MGVVTGIPLEFQFGTNWARFSNFAGEVIGQTLAMEGVFAFFLESTFLGLFPLRRETAGPEAAPRGRRRPGRGLVAVRLFHHRRQRLHAAPCRIQRWARMASCISRASVNISSIPGRSGSMPTT